MTSNEKNDRDVMVIGPCNGDGSHVAIRYRNGEPLDSGSLRRLKHGRPISGEPVRLHPHEEGPGNDVEYLLTDGPELDGPAMVNSQAFRNGWDEIFEKRNLFGSEVQPGSA
ncbi:hypothetical protein LCGC14_2076740 [marine sediment metagenome]|uniref:Uncharacterized protein n=1 Tax=marine sediment metagenome TaxID=412755 RepID=A0A0F9F486_9ZZZZ